MNQRVLAVVIASIAVACGSSGGSDLYEHRSGDGSAGSGAQGTGGSGALTGGSSGVGGSTAGVGGATTGGNGGSVGTGASSGASGTSAGGAIGTGGSAGAIGSGGASASGGTGAIGGTNSSGGTTGNGGTGGSGTGGSGGIAQNATVPCGSQPCATGSGSFCCFAVQSGTTSQQTCMSPGGTCSLPETQAFCDGPEDCPGGVCCGTYTMFSVLEIYSRLECATSCTGANQRIVCDPAHPSSCPSGTCQSYYTLPAGYEVCQ